MYRLSHHAIQRIHQRQLPVEWLVAALDGERFAYKHGTVILCDVATRCAVVIEPENRVILTAFLLRPNKFRQLFKRRKKGRRR